MSSKLAEADPGAGPGGPTGTDRHEPGGGRRRFRVRPTYVLALFIPIAIALEAAHLLHIAEPAAWMLFTASALGVVPTAALMGRATEELAARAGPGIGGLLNVTFGNFPELVIAFLAMVAGLQEVVRASIVGSIIGNILLVMGAAMFAGGLGRDRQVFNSTAAGAQAAMLMLALVALLLPAAYDILKGGALPSPGTDRVESPPGLAQISFIAALVLIGSYVAGLVFSLKTHRRLFNPFEEEDVVDEAHWSVRRSVVMLAVAGIAVGVMSEILVGSIEAAADTIGLSEFFIGVFVVAIVGNAAEHWVAVLFAYKNKMDLAVNVAIGSSAQIALFVAPVLVLSSFFVGPEPLLLIFSGYELAGMLFAVLITNFVVQEGESNWFQGLQLLAVYALLGLVFFFA